MTKISAFREHDVVRDGGGRFDVKHQTQPEVAVGDDFDMATFMQEPPAAAPLSILQPVIYTEAGGEEVHAVLLSPVDSFGWAVIAEREPGTLGFTLEGHRNVEARYLRVDENIELSVLRRQDEALAIAEKTAQEALDMDQATQRGAELHSTALGVMDALAVDSIVTRAKDRQQHLGIMDRQLIDLGNRDLVGDEASAIFTLAGDKWAPAAVQEVENLDHERWYLASCVSRARVLEVYSDWTDIDEDIVSDFAAGFDEARDLGARITASQDALISIDGDLDALGVDRLDDAFGRYVDALDVEDRNEYNKAVREIDRAFKVCHEHGLLEYADWQDSGLNTSATAKLVRAAGQAEILRCFKPETGLTDEQLDTVAGVFTDAVKVWERKQAA